MAETKSAWGIDIGQSALKAIKLRFDASTEQVVAEAFDYVQFPKILSQPDAVPEEILPQAMETFLGRNDLKGSLVAISVPGQSSLARFIQLPPVERSKLHEIVKYEARQQIPFALEEVIWDYQPLGNGIEEGGFLLDAEVGLFAMKRDQVMAQLRPYMRAKVEVELIQIAPLALYNVLSVDELGIRRDSEEDAGDEHFIVLDMGCDNTTLMVSNGAGVWIRNVPIGGNHFTRALTKDMKLSFAKAEHLKCNATKSPDPRAVFQALRPVFNDYVSEIQRSIGYFSSVNRQAKIAKVIGLGNGFKLAGLQKFLQQNLQYDVERPDSYKVLTGDAVLNSPLFADNLLSFAVPYGLALQAIGMTRIHTSLLPPEIATARKIRRKKPWAVAAAATMLLGFSLSTVGNAFSFQKVHTEEFAKAEEKAKAFGGEVSSLKQAYDTQKSRYDASRQKLNELVTGRREIAWMELFNAITDCLPRDEEENEVVTDDLQKKHQISLSEVSASRVSDVSTWHSTLNEHQKSFMSVEERENAPSGEGYIVTIRGRHWHHDPTDPTESGVLYVVHHFLENLQQPTVQREGYDQHDVGRMGITHATIIDHKQGNFRFNEPKKPEVAVSRFGAGARRGVPMGRRGPMADMYEGSEGGEFGSGGPMGTPGLTIPGTSGSSTGELKEIPETSFVVQFVYQPIPKSERVETGGDELADSEG